MTTPLVQTAWDSPPRRIVVLRALQLGDLLVTVPALRALRAGFPAAEITLIGLPWAASFAERFKRYIDRFVEFAGYPGINEVEATSEDIAAFLADQRAYGYDLAIQLHGNGRTSNGFIHELATRATCAYYEHNRPTWLTFGAVYPDDQPEILRNLQLIGLLGCPTTNTTMEFPLYADDVAAARMLLAGVEAGPLIGLHPGARPPARRWPAEYFATIADACAERFGARVILTGGPGEEATVRAVSELMRYPAWNVAGQTSLGSLAALIADMDLFISNDTGPAHLANALGTPSVTLFGPADPRRWAPLDLMHHPILRHAVPCSPCSFWECPIDHRCLRGIAPQAVMELAATLLH